VTFYAPPFPVLVQNSNTTVSKSAYERKLREWGFSKNVNWRSVVGSIKKRQRNGKKSAIDVNAYRKLSPRQVERGASRHFLSALDQMQLALGEGKVPCFEDYTLLEF
jgi:hypothetical protein